MSEFYDYGTGIVSNKNDLFDTKLTGMSYYNQFLDNPEYMRSAKNLDSKIVQMTPKEYFAECAKIFNSTPDKQLRYTRSDEETLNHLKDVIQVAKKKFPLTFINYAESTQEGRHRMYVAAELTSWDTDFPVLVIDWFDKDEHLADVEAKRVRELERRIDEAIAETLHYRYDSEDPDSLQQELQIQMNHAFGHYFGDPDVEFIFDVDPEHKTYSVTKDGVTRTFDDSDVNWEASSIEDTDTNIEELPDEDIDAFLAKYL